MKGVCAAILFIVSGVLFASIWMQLGDLWHSAWDYKLHHEVASLLCMDLIRPILALAAFAAGIVCLGKNQALKLERDAPMSLIALVPVLVACSLLFENEAFFAMFNSKEFPVHPPEIIAYPSGAWVAPRTHALAAFALTLIGAIGYFLLREPKTDAKVKEKSASSDH